MEFPLDAEVHCVDGPCGQLTAVIVDPATEKVAYVGVRDADEPHLTYLVAVDLVIRTTPDLIQLSCTRSELAGMEPFTETEYVEVWTPYYADELGYGYTGPQTVAVERQLVPPGTLAVSRGMAVEATDGYVGTVDELVVDPASGRVTHFVLGKGHLWGEIEVTLGVAQVERVEGSTVYLKLDKASIEVLPSVQARRLYSKQEINVMDIELVVVTFAEVDRAIKAQNILKTLDKNGVTEIRNMAVLVKEQDGKTTVRETADVDAGQGALFGAIVGGLVGVLGGPAGVVLGAAAGAATGHVAAGKIDRGFSDEYLKQIQDGLQPGSSALVTLVEKKSVEKVVEALADLDGQLVRQQLTDNIVQQLLPDQAESRADDARGGRPRA
jgi:uncharacterized membrane protein/sporulation protein YlmC with PRC-barrel domain